MSNLMEFETQAVLGMSNFGGIAIMLDPYNQDYLHYKWYENAPERAEIYQDYEDDTGLTRPYFLIEEDRYYLDEFMRTNI